MKCTSDWHKKEFVENVENDGNPESNCQKKFKELQIFYCNSQGTWNRKIVKKQTCFEVTSKAKKKSTIKKKLQTEYRSEVVCNGKNFFF